MTAKPAGMARPEPAELIRRFGLEPLPVEGGHFRQTWRSGDLLRVADLPARYDPARYDATKPAGTAIVALLTDEPDSFSAMHLLPTDEVWHYYLGDPLDLLLLWPGGRSEHVVLGPNVLGGHEVQVVVPAGTWMGARVAAGGRWTLFGTTLAPGFTSADFEAGGADELAAGWPDAAELVRTLTRPHAPRAMPPGL